MDWFLKIPDELYCTKIYANAGFDRKMLPWYDVAPAFMTTPAVCLEPERQTGAPVSAGAHVIQRRKRETGLAGKSHRTIKKYLKHFKESISLL